MSYAIHYIKSIVPNFIFVCTLGLLTPLVNTKVRITLWFLELFWIMDALPILISGGKITSVWHSKANDLFFKRNLRIMAADNDKLWKKQLFSVICQVLFCPDVF
jgi:hypothetical protein